MRWSVLERSSQKRQLKLPKKYAMTSDTNTQEQRHHGQFSVETERELMSSRVKLLEIKVAKLEDDKSNALMWGVRTLGMLLLALGTYVYNLVATGKH